jgi:hypothetical protein
MVLPEMPVSFVFPSVWQESVALLSVVPLYATIRVPEIMAGELLLIVVLIVV